MKLKKGLPALPVALLVLSVTLSDCAIGETERAIPTQIRNIEVQGNEINIYANKPLRLGAYIQPSPPKLILTINNADLASTAVKEGEGTGGVIKSWQASVVTYEKSVEGETRTGYDVKLVADLTKNVTYQLTSTDSGAKMVLEEIKIVEKEYTPTMIEIPKELYPSVQRMMIGPGGVPTGKAVAPITTEDEKAAREMLKEILPEPLKVEKLPPATALNDITYRTVDKTFEVVITGNGEFKDFKIGTLDKPTRVYLDIFGVKSNLPNDKFQVNTGMVREVRLGKYPDKTRAVIELKGPIKDAHIANIQNKIVVKIVY